MSSGPKQLPSLTKFLKLARYTGHLAKVMKTAKGCLLAEEECAELPGEGSLPCGDVSKSHGGLEVEEGSLPCGDISKSHGGLEFELL